MKKGNLKYLLLLHLMLMLYSLSGIASKLAAQQEFMSFKFCLCYAAIILLLGVYAIGWQQVIKRLPLTTAFANKAVTVVWGLIWGLVVFSESITVGKAIGAAMVIAGVVIFAREPEQPRERTPEEPEAAPAEAPDAPAEADEKAGEAE